MVCSLLAEQHLQALDLGEVRLDLSGLLAQQLLPAPRPHLLGTHPNKARARVGICSGLGSRADLSVDLRKRLNVYQAPTIH